MLALRFAITISLLWPLYALLPGWRRFIRPQSRSQIVACFLVGSANTLSMGLYFVALQDVSASLATLLFSTAPAMVAVVLLFFGERLRTVTVLRIVVAFAGFALLTAAGSGAQASLIGIAFILGCALTYAIHLVLYQQLLGGTSTRTNTLYILSSMAFWFLLVFLIPGQAALVASVTPVAWLEIAAFAIFTTIIARLLMFVGVDALGGTQVALLGIAEPLFVVMLSIILLGESLASAQWAGAAFILVSLVLAGRR